MKYNPDKHHRKSTRLQKHDYSSAGAYFITLCTFQREHLFGEIIDGEMKVNEYGKLVQDEWYKSAEIRKEIKLDEFIVMPNHIHGIVWILPPDPSLSNDVVANDTLTSLPSNVGARGSSPLHTPASTMLGTGKKSLGSFVGGFKGSCSKRINQLRSTPGITVWHRNYHDRIIRNDRELYGVCQYIQHNPQNWETDEENQ